jgi:hypothetical protein
MIKYSKIEWKDCDGNIKEHSVDRVFWLAVVPKAYGTLKSWFGINIGISIPHENSSKEKEFYDSIFGTNTYKNEHFTEAYLIGENKERIPVVIGQANGYEESMGTSCLFGYFSPLILATDEKPKMNYFGSIKKELTYRDNVAPLDKD